MYPLDLALLLCILQNVVADRLKPASDVPIGQCQGREFNVNGGKLSTSNVALF